MEFNRRKGEKEMKVLNPGEKAKLPDGRTVTFLQTEYPECDGCVFEFEECGKQDSYVGPCGSGRPDGKLGIFIECKSDERHG